MSERIFSGMNPPGLLLVISAPSGAGKTTLARMLRDRLEDAVISVSCTTRKPRGEEKDGVDYHFVEAATFERMVSEGDFAEWATVHGERYGTPRSEIEGHLSERRVVIFDIDVQGGEQILAAYPGAVMVLIFPPSFEVLEERLRGRSTDDEKTIQRRLSKAREEMRRGLGSYNYLVVNDELQVAFANLESIVRAERCRITRLGATPS